ncbi:NAD(P)H-hydrate dehydratase [Shewanella sp. C32]|uniref:Bifunctional NAD(P)H-hydrate repair enzyme n=1 Tax=Shewanella electrica TaxID=515560 RepID=A0ABT2FL69_9GAMM|nr:NAD(P)H-hydrate dehydratase [Shewanella electrica]MCH1925611.1 NAD(P)H-hydrate dehydratase [Shewanella electrica]MCS4557082.1 NAD(P)H-hydrate dehydratase [Shewanella electrica]
MAQDLSHLPSALYLTTQVRQAELDWAQQHQQPLYALVESAGLAACDVLMPHLAAGARVLVVAGQGNNGADALICYFWLRQRGINATLFILPASKASDEWQQAWQLLGQHDYSAVYELPDVSHYDVIVDGLLGTGVSGELRPNCADVIARINGANAWVLSLDVPSGINADTGAMAGGAVIADMTLCMGALKQGLLTGDARNCAGELVFAELGLSEFLPASDVQRVGRDYLAKVLPARARNAHKGSNGRVTLIGGDVGMAGAICLASEACLRSGAGLVAVVSRPEHQLLLNSHRAELMFCGCELVDMEVYSRLGWANVLVLGPGLGKQDWGYNLFKAVALSEKPVVVDADALNLLSEEPRRDNQWVLTPHPGEASRLLGCDIKTVEADRFAAVRQLQQRYGGVVLLKGAGTLIYDGQSLYVAPVGNPGLASGGCGDVLSGIIGALMAQGLTHTQATVAGVIIHGEAADKAAVDGERGMLASDLFPWIRRLVNTV